MGTAAGGGFPQWNCWCRCCREARTNPENARQRSQSSAAISADGHHWFLLNASPDVRDQLSRLPSNGHPSSTRYVPIEGVVLTDAELDHTLGVTLLREARHLPIYATPAIRAILERDSRILPVVRAFGDVPVTELPPDTIQALRHRDGEPSGLTVEAFTVPAPAPVCPRRRRGSHRRADDPRRGRRKLCVRAGLWRSWARVDGAAGRG